MALTKATVEGSKPRDKPYDLRDGGPRGRTGLILRTYPSGKRTFFYQRSRGEKWYKIGPAGPVTLERARDRVDELFQMLQDGIDPAGNAGSLTLGEFLDTVYRPHFLAHHKSAKSLAPLVAFKPLRNKRLADLSVEDVKRWRTQRLSAGKKAATVNRCIAALKAALSFAVDEGYLVKHPLTGLSRLPVEQQNRVRYLTDDEEKRLRAALLAREERIRAERRSANAWRADRGYTLMLDLSNLTFADHLRPMVLLTMNTGIRQGELFSLTWRDVVGDVLTVQSGKAKSRRTRHIPLNHEAADTLKAWKDEQGEDHYVFTSPKGGRFDNVKKAWQAVLQEAGIEDFRWHDIRHHFASKLAMRNVALNTIRELLGHSDLSMTLRYAHLSPSHTRAAVDALADVTVARNSQEMERTVASE